MKAFEDPLFMNSREARPLRIMSEFFEPAAKLAKYNIENIVVFFGSARILPAETARKYLIEMEQNGTPKDIEDAKTRLKMSEYYETAAELSKRIATWSKEQHNNDFYICSGGGPGIMEAANKGAYLAGCHNLGFNIVLPFEQINNPYITKELIFNFHYFFMRKFWFAYLAKAIVVFPGGFGTLDELFEILTLIQTKKLTKSLPIVLFGCDYFNELLNFELLKKYRLILPEDLNLFLQTDDIDEAFNFVTRKLTTYTPNEPI